MGVKYFCDRLKYADWEGMAMTCFMFAGAALLFTATIILAISFLMDFI